MHVSFSLTSTFLTVLLKLQQTVAYFFTDLSTWDFWLRDRRPVKFPIKCNFIWELRIYSSICFFKSKLLDICRKNISCIAMQKWKWSADDYKETDVFSGVTTCFLSIPGSLLKINKYQEQNCEILSVAFNELWIRSQIEGRDEQRHF